MGLSGRGAQLHDGVLEQRPRQFRDTELPDSPEAALPLLAGGGAEAMVHCREDTARESGSQTATVKLAFDFNKLTRQPIHKDFILTR